MAGNIADLEMVVVHSNSGSDSNSSPSSEEQADRPHEDRPARMEENEKLDDQASRVESIDSESDDQDTRDPGRDPVVRQVTVSARRKGTVDWLHELLELYLFWLKKIPKLMSSPRFRPDDRYDSVKYEQIEDYPPGYPQLAALLNSDPDFPVYRRFGTLRSRVILHRQHEISKLEEKLFQLDKTDGELHIHRLQSIRKDQADKDSERSSLINTIDAKLKEYDGLLSRERESRRYAKPTNRNYWSLIHYLWNEKSIVASEITFSQRKDDFIILSDEQPSPFHGFVQDLIYRFGSHRFQNWLATEEQRQSTKNPLIRLFSKQKINILVQAIVTLVFTTTFMVPVGLLSNLVTSQQAKLGIIFGSILLFPIIAYMFSRPANHHLCAMTAAYAAVLVVFLANLNGNASTNKTS